MVNTVSLRICEWGEVQTKAIFTAPRGDMVYWVFNITLGLKADLPPSTLYIKWALVPFQVRGVTNAQ
jgi:hypothetical protein